MLINININIYSCVSMLWRVMVFYFYHIVKKKKEKRKKNGILSFSLLLLDSSRDRPPLFLFENSLLLTISLTHSDTLPTMTRPLASLLSTFETSWLVDDDTHETLSHSLVEPLHFFFLYFLLQQRSHSLCVLKHAVAPFSFMSTPHALMNNAQQSSLFDDLLQKQL